MTDAPAVPLAPDPAMAGHDAAPPAIPPDTAAEVAPAIPPDIARLFRHSLAEGRLHPLMPLLMRYRHERTSCDGDAAP